VSNLAYYLAWLAAGLLVMALASAAIARQARLRLARRAKAEELLDALARYSGWVTAQRGTAFFEGGPQEGESPLREVRAIQEQWFPQLCEETAQLLLLHARIIGFLRAQHALRLKDAEAWLESDHDQRLMTLWRLHRHAVHAAADRLKLLFLGTGRARHGLLRRLGRFPGGDVVNDGGL
jgi:hypothetical protein